MYMHQRAINLAIRCLSYPFPKPENKNLKERQIRCYAMAKSKWYHHRHHRTPCHIVSTALILRSDLLGRVQGTAQITCHHHQVSKPTHSKYKPDSQERLTSPSLYAQKYTPHPIK
jgi:hypothetical protein